MRGTAAPLVSVVIPYYNHGRFLHQTVESALCAYRGPLEVLLVDDGSVEQKAAHYVEGAAALSPSVRVIRQPNQGLSAARNAGLRAASGEFVQFLDSDDMLVPGKIDLQVAHMSMQPTIGTSLSNYLLSDSEGSKFWRDGDPISRFDFTLNDFLFEWERGFSLPIHVALFRREVLSKHAFDARLKGKEDWLFWCNLAASGIVLSYLPVFGAIYRQHHSMSKSFRAMGESFLTAAALIEDLAGSSRDAFRVATLAWYEKFYRPQLDSQSQESSSPISPRVEASVPPDEPLPMPSAALLSGEADIVFSVIVPVYNHYEYLRECVASIISQDCSARFEVILVDDASSDPRVAPFLAQCAAVSPNVRVFENQRNSGIVHTLSHAAEAAKGRFLVFVDCDDLLAQGALEIVLRALKPDTDYLFTDRTDIDAGGKPLRVARYGGYPGLRPSGRVGDDLLDGMVASHLKVLRRAMFVSAGGFDGRVAGVQDWELALRLAQGDAKFQYLPQSLYSHRIHKASVTGENAVRQFYLTNVVRRRYATAAYRPALVDEMAITRARALLGQRDDSAPSIRVFRDVGSLRPALLKQAWRAGCVCAFVTSDALLVHELNVLREYNSYLDIISVSEEKTACALVGYIWHRDALMLSSELSTG